MMGRTAALVRFWEARSRREQAILVAAGALTLAAALYAFLWEPGQAARSRYSDALPRLRAQVDDMRRQQREIAALRSKLGTEPQRPDIGPLLRAAAARAPFGKSVQRLEALSADRVFLVAAPVDFDAWLEWVGTLQRELSVRLDTCKVTALDQPGLVRVEATYVSAGASTVR